MRGSFCVSVLTHTAFLSRSRAQFFEMYQCLCTVTLVGKHSTLLFTNVLCWCSYYFVSFSSLPVHTRAWLTCFMNMYTKALWFDYFASNLYMILTNIYVHVRTRELDLRVLYFDYFLLVLAPRLTSYMIPDWLTSMYTVWVLVHLIIFC